jgi:Tfp pilus assembly protein PilN
MRPVNLIPPDARAGDAGAMRTGGIPYVIMAALGLLLLGVIVLAFTGKSVDDKKAEVQRLQQDLDAATAKAQNLNSFAEFGAVEQTRSSTVASLAQSRFDWSRVMNELALVIPQDVWLTKLAGSVNPEVSLEDAPDLQIRDSIAGPALEIVGCATSQDAVAGFVADLEDIDGVTRVGVASSERPEDETAASNTGTETTSGSNGGEGDDCRTRDFIAKFEIAVAFDSVPVPGSATTAPGVPAPLTSDASGTGEVQAQQTANQQAVGQAQADANQATNVLPGG